MHIKDLDGQRIRQARERLNLSREKLSELSGVSARAIQNIEQGVIQSPGLKVIQAIVNALEMGVESKLEAQKPKTVSDMTPQDLQEFLFKATQEILAAKQESAELERLKKIEAHLRSFGDDFFEALMDLDKYHAKALRPGLGLLAPESPIPAASTGRSSSTASHAQPVAPSEKRRRAGRD